MKINKIVDDYKVYRSLRKRRFVKRNTFLLDLHLHPRWIKYKLWRFFEKKKSWSKNKSQLSKSDCSDSELEEIFGFDLKPTNKKIKKYLNKFQ